MIVKCEIHQIWSFWVIWCKCGVHKIWRSYVNYNIQQNADQKMISLWLALECLLDSFNHILRLNQMAMSSYNLQFHSPSAHGVLRYHLGPHRKRPQRQAGMGPAQSRALGQEQTLQEKRRKIWRSERDRSSARPKLDGVTRPPAKTSGNTLL